jgi:hypothetical protein
MTLVDPNVSDQQLEHWRASVEQVLLEKGAHVGDIEEFKVLRLLQGTSEIFGICTAVELVSVFDCRFEKPLSSPLRGYQDPWKFSDPYVPIIDPWKTDPYVPRPIPQWERNRQPRPWWETSQTICGVAQGSTGYLSTDAVLMNNISTSKAVEVGITAPGSISDQEFNTVSSFPLESQRHVIIMRLLGEHQGKSVISAVTTRAQITCQNCGHRNRSTVKFCPECGTSVTII